MLQKNGIIVPDVGNRAKAPICIRGMGIERALLGGASHA